LKRRTGRLALLVIAMPDRAQLFQSAEAASRFGRKGSSKEHARALKSIPKVRLPAKDPVYGVAGPLLDFWK
jgi:hypothetical protein